MMDAPEGLSIRRHGLAEPTDGLQNFAVVVRFQFPWSKQAAGGGCILTAAEQLAGRRGGGGGGGSRDHGGGMEQPAGDQERLKNAGRSLLGATRMWLQSRDGHNDVQPRHREYTQAVVANNEACEELVNGRLRSAVDGALRTNHMPHRRPTTSSSSMSSRTHTSATYHRGDAGMIDCRWGMCIRVATLFGSPATQRRPCLVAWSCRSGVGVGCHTAKPLRCPGLHGRAQRRTCARFRGGGNS
jgi:hypothetical protein